MSEKITELTTENFEEFIKEGTTVVDFWASWCAPCQMMIPIFEKAAEELSDVKFAKINVEEQQELAQRFQVMSIPTLIIFKDGIQEERTVGVMPKESLIELATKVKSQ